MVNYITYHLHLFCIRKSEANIHQEVFALYNFSWQIENFIVEKSLTDKPAPKCFSHATFCKVSTAVLLRCIYLWLYISIWRLADDYIILPFFCSFIKSFQCIFGNFVISINKGCVPPPSSLTFFNIQNRAAVTPLFLWWNTSIRESLLAYSSKSSPLPSVLPSSISSNLKSG